MSLANTNTTRARPVGAMEEMLAPLRPSRPMSLEAKIVLVVFAVLAVWGTLILTFGVPALVWPMKFIVPAIFVGLVAITWSK